MKKNLTCFVCFFFIPIIIFAREVHEKEALLASQNFVNKISHATGTYLPKQVPGVISTIDYCYSENSKKILAFIVKLEPKGFVVISGDTDIEPVIAYSFCHDWNPDTSETNIFYRILRYDLKMRTESIGQLSRDAVAPKDSLWQNLLNLKPSEIFSYSFRQWPQEGMTSTSGWVESTWHQNAPYKNFCPIDPETGDRSIVGCVATALAQVINYHKTIGNLHFDVDDSYTTNTREIHIDSDSMIYNFPSFHRLNGYINELEFKYQNNDNLADQDLAALSFSCGIVAEMDYTSSSSGANIDSVASILTSKFGYHSADYKAYLSGDNSTSDFYYVLQENMMNAFPAILQIGVTGNYRLHAIVCDGYNTENFYHLNFGWGSSSPDDITDAWYLLPDGMPAGYRFVISAVINIDPDFNFQLELASDNKVVYLDACLVGDLSRYNSFNLRNEGNSPININYIVASDHFLIGKNTTNSSDSLGPAVLEPGNEMIIYVWCIPDTIGSTHGQAIVHSSAMNPYLNFHLSGFGAPEGGTIISRGNVSGIWDRNHSPYYICGDINIADGQQLQIKAGTDVIFWGRFKMTTGTNASLIAKGTNSDSICFKTSDYSNEGWSGLEFRESGDDDTLSYCIISDGRGNPVNLDYGGAMSIYSSSPAVMNSRLVDNWATYGGAIYCMLGNPSIKFTTIENNYASESGGALYLEQSSPIIENSLFYKNSAETNGAFLNIRESLPTFINITVADNVDGRYLGGFMYLDDSYITFKNSILWTNEGDNLEILLYEKVTMKFEYSDIRTTYLYQEWPIIGYPYEQNKIIWGAGNIATDPLFTHSNDFKYVLQEASPCIDAGNPGLEFNDSEDPDHPGFALWPAMATLRNDMGAYGGQSSQFVIPVELVSFQAKVSDHDVLLTWETLSESNNFGFEIERGSDDYSFRRIAFIKGNGTTTEPHTYSYIDNNLKAGDYHYRLKQIDNSGVFNYSEPIKVNLAIPLSFSLSQNCPNPFNSITVIQFAVQYPSKIEILIFNTIGKKVKTLVRDYKKAGVYKICWDGKDDLGSHVSNGCYFIKMQAARFYCVKKLMIIK